MRTSTLRALGRMGFLAVASAVGLSALGCNQMNGWVMNESGTAYYERGNYAMARQEFQRAMADDPYNADFAHNLATAMKKQGDVAGAERVYRHALNINPSHQPSHHELAQLMVGQGRQAEAMDLVQTWVDTQPYVAEAYVEKAWLQQETGDLAGAEQTLQQALQISPNHDVATAQLGQIYQKSGRNDLAVAMYQRSLYSNWSQPEVQSRVATIQGTTTPVTAPTTRFATNPQTYAPATAYAQPIPMTAARYGTTQRVTALHPLPTYQHVTGTIAPGAIPAGTVATGPVPAGTVYQGTAAYPGGLPVATLPQAPHTVATHNIQPQPDPLMNADPQHTHHEHHEHARRSMPQMTASMPVVSPF